MHTGSTCSKCLLLVAASLLAAFSAIARGEETTTLAIYQFRPENIAAMGFESDVMLAIRNEMENYAGVDLMAKRDMEDVLARRDIAQEYSVLSAVEGGRQLSVRYVLVGSVSKHGAKIEADLMLVDVNLGETVKSWRTSYRTRNEIDETASDLVASIVAVAEKDRRQASVQAQGGERGATGVLLGLTATPRQSHIEIAWQDTPSDNVLGYNVYRAESRAGPYSFLGSGDGMRYRDNTAKEGVRYYYQVSEFNFDGSENRSARVVDAELLSTVASTRVSPPLIYRLTPLAGGVNLEFVASLEGDSEQPSTFRIYRAADDSAWSVIGEVEASGRRGASDQKLKYAFNDVQLGEGADVFRYAVTAVLADNAESARSDVFEYTPPQLGPPEVVQQYLLREGRLRWQPTRMGNGYRVYRREGDDPWQRVGEIDGRNVTRFTDTEGLLDGREYEYSYTVFDEFSESPRSAPVSVSTKPPPLPPSGLVASQGQARRVTLRWDPVRDPDVQSYVVYRANHSGATQVDMSPVAVLDADDGAQWVDTGEASPLQDGASYAYAVATRNRLGGEGALSLAVEGNTKPAPAAVSAAVSVVKGDAILVSWQATGDDVSTYLLSRRWSGGEWEELARVPATQLEYRDEVLRPYSAVEYRVVVVDTTELASEPVITALIDSPAELLLATGDEPLLRRSALNWNSQSLVDGFAVQRKSPGEDQWQQVASIPDGTATSYIDSEGLLDGTTYQYRVLPLAAGATLGASNSVECQTKLVAAPEQVAASAGRAREVVLEWPAAQDEDVAGYVVYRAKGRQAASALQEHARIKGVGSTVFVDKANGNTAVEHGVEYSYAIAAENTLGGVGPLSEVVTGSSKPLPEPVYNLVAFTEDEAINLSWEYENRENVERFLVFAREKDADWELISELDRGDNRYRHDRLKPYVTLQYRMQVRDVDELDSEPVDSAELVSPRKVEVEVNSVPLLREVQLTWNSQFDIDGFLLERRERGQREWADVKTIRDGDSTGYTDKKGLADGAAYQYRLVALEDGRKLGHSNIVDAATKELPAPPSAVTARSGMHASVELTWTPLEDTDVGGYTIYRVTDGQLEKLDTVSGHDSARYLDDGGVFSSLENGTDYTYAVAAYNRYRVEGERSELVTASTKPVPSPVTGIAAAEENGVIRLSWKPSPEKDVSHYLVSRGSGTGCSGFRQVAKVPAGKTVFSDDEARPQSQYCYRLVAVDDDDLESAPSPVVEIVTPALVSVE